MRLEPGGSLAPYNLVIAYCKKVGAGLRSIQEYVNENIGYLKNHHPFLQPLFEPRSPLVLRRYFVLNLLATSLLATPAFAQKPPRYAYTSFDVPGGTLPQPHVAATTRARSWATSTMPSAGSTATS